MKQRSAFVLILFSLVILSACAESGAQEKTVLPEENSVAGAQETAPEPESKPEVDPERGEPDFGNSRWGDTMEQVSAQEGGGRWRLNAHIAGFAGLSTVPYFSFDEEGILDAARYAGFSSYDEGKPSRYETVRDYLAATYGEPASEAFYAPDGAILPERAAAKQALGRAEANWKVKNPAGECRTDILLRWDWGGKTELLFSPVRKDAARGELPDVGNSYWGETMEQVYANEGDGVWYLDLDTEIAGFQVSTNLGFQGPELLFHFAYFDLTKTDMGGRDDAEKYALVQDYFSSLYGAPEGEIYRSPEGAELSSLAGAELASAVWRVPASNGALRTIVFLQMYESEIGANVSAARSYPRTAPILDYS